jgi:cell division protein FtsB
MTSLGDGSRVSSDAMMRVVTYILILLLLLLQYSLWFGKGSWLTVWDMDKKVEAQKQINDQNQRRNASLDAEVRDLKRGTDALEERARSELGMVKRGEKFFQVIDEGAPTASGAAIPPKDKVR